MAKKHCQEEGCANQVYTAGKCRKHGDRPTCSSEGCTTKARTYGVCSRHGAPKPLCGVEGCSKVDKRNGFCIRHAREQDENLQLVMEYERLQEEIENVKAQAASERKRLLEEIEGVKAQASSLEREALKIKGILNALHRCHKCNHLFEYLEDCEEHSRDCNHLCCEFCGRSFPKDPTFREHLLHLVFEHHHHEVSASVVCRLSECPFCDLDFEPESEEDFWTCSTHLKECPKRCRTCSITFQGLQERKSHPCIQAIEF